MEERSVEHNNYRFSHNTQEKTDEIAGKGNHHTAQFWEYSPRIARRWNVDPKPNVSISPYATFANSPILMGDPLGDTTWVYSNNGRHIATIVDNLENQIHFMHFNVNSDYKATNINANANFWGNYYRTKSVTYIGSNTIADMKELEAYGNKHDFEVAFVATYGSINKDMSYNKELRLTKLPDKYREGKRGYDLHTAIKEMFPAIASQLKIFATGHLHPTKASNVGQSPGYSLLDSRFLDLVTPTGSYGYHLSDVDFQPMLYSKPGDKYNVRQHAAFIISEYGFSIYGTGTNRNIRTDKFDDKIIPNNKDKFKYERIDK